MSKLAEAQISLTIANEQEPQIEELQNIVAGKVDSAELENYLAWDASGLTIRDANNTAGVNINAEGVSIYANDSAQAQARVTASTMQIERAETKTILIGAYLIQYMSDGSIVLKEA